MPAVLDLIDVLQRSLTLPRGPSVDFALALEWYKVPEADVHPRNWRNTELGELVRRGKYWYTDPSRYEDLRTVGLALVARLRRLIDEHPLLSTVDAVVAVPGHDASVVSFGARLASSVARQEGLLLAKCVASTRYRTPAKNLDPAGRQVVIVGQFSCAVDLSNMRVLIIDDVYGSGTTVAETARAARAAGAVEVASLCAVRTMRTM
jgi:adenine/guanine phosphoribosyltransferase-like PRPP-binding protein